MAAKDEVAWEGFDPDHVILQRECPDCDGGLLYVPARYCQVCQGTGFLTRIVPTVPPPPKGTT